MASHGLASCRTWILLSEAQMIDLQNETTISLSQAARLLPPFRRGRPVTLSCVLRWVLQGVKTPDGRRIRLDALRLGGKWITSMEAIQRFAEAQTPALDRPVETTPRSTTRRRRAADRAEKELVKVGI
jgi:hypothetical protein